jgi:23S rRNA pseudouridine2605 synthase
LRLNQAIAQTGLCSRRKADELIAAGKVRVNGITCTDFSRDVDPDNDSLEADGELLSFKTHTYVALHKPVGIVTTTSDEQDRETVIDLLPKKLRHLKPVGRLDMYSEGLLILTNDGDFALKLTHPRHHLPKLYLIRLRGPLSDKHANMIARGVPLEDGKTLPAKVRIVERNKTYTEVEITLVEGRNRQIRRMFAYLGYTVLRLVRLAIGGLQLGQVAPGSWRYLTSQEVAALLSQSNDANDA